MKKRIFSSLVLLILIFTLCFPYVKGHSEEEISANNEKVIFLTFDDGPAGKVTTDILDILKRNDVKGTFFLVGGQVKGQESLLKRMVDEGHSLGLHSMTHNRDNLYSSNEGFMREMLKTQEVIYEATNVKANILRFPFGCNNNSYKLKKSLVEAIHDKNLKIYDWTVDSGDGENFSASPGTFIQKSKSKSPYVVLLMHCGYVNKTSVQALQSIIDYYKANGYTFKAITEETPEVFHYLNKH